MDRAAAMVIDNPFPGLRPFHGDEEHLFFGREGQVDTMVDKLAKTGFLAVVGTSGSGKSSLVSCGLRPALHRGLMAKAGTSWRMAQFRPGSGPIRAMARALAKDGLPLRSVDSSGALSLEGIVEATLRMSKLGIADLYEQAKFIQGTNLLLVVDQFEELFRFRMVGASKADGGDRTQENTAFVNLLLEPKAEAKFPIYIVLTMRSDFLGDCAEFPGLPEAINDGQYLVPRMTREERKAAIAGPVGVGAADISPVLLTRLVNDVGENPDQLSILQHALNRTWAGWQHQGRREGPLELRHYEAIGTMVGALDRHAEKAFAELITDREKRICEKIFKALTDKGSDARGVRRPTSFATLCNLADADQTDVVQVIDTFRKPSRSFLMPPQPELLESETIIDISHESLMRGWERLKAWADEEAQSAQVYRRLSETAALYESGRAGLWRDPELQLALEWREKEKPTPAWAGLYRGGFAQSMSFLNESEAQRDQEVREKEERQARELEQAQALVTEQRRRAEEQTRAARRLRWWVAAFGVVALLAVCAVLYGRFQRARADQQELQSTSNGLIEDAKETMQFDPELSVLLAMGAIHSTEGLVENNEALNQLDVAIRESSLSHAKLTLVGHTGGVTAVTFSADGKYLATGSWDKTARIWDAASGGPSGKPSSHAGPVTAVAFSPDGKYLATGSWDKTARLWDAASGELTHKLSGHAGAVTAVAFSPDGKYFATASSDKSARLWDPASGRLVRTLLAHESTVTAVAFSPDGKRLATASDDGTAKVWDAASGKALQILTEHAGGVTAVTFSPPDGRALATASEDGTVKLWNAISGKHLRTLTSDAGTMTCVAFSPDGSRVATASGYKTQLWDAASGALLPPPLLGHRASVKSIAFSPDGSRLATASEDNTVKVMEVIAPEQQDVKLSLRQKNQRQAERLFRDREERLFRDREEKLQENLLSQLQESRPRQRGIKGLMTTMRSLIYGHPPVSARYQKRQYQKMATARGQITRTLSSDECHRYLHVLPCPAWVQALDRVVRGSNLARSGEIQRAIASFQEAIELDHDIRLDPGLEARRLASESLKSEGIDRARSGDVKAAVASFKRAKELNDSLQLDPEADAKRFASEGWMVKGRNLASVGDTKGAITAFRQARILDPTLHIDPVLEAERPVAESLLAQAAMSMSNNRFKDAATAYVKAITAYERAPGLDPDRSIRAEAWNDLCWEGSLRGHAAEVMNACEQAVKLAGQREPASSDIHDSRGLARALTGDSRGAIEDFNHYIKNTTDLVRKMQRQQWVDQLRAGKRPFAPDVLQQLLGP